MKLDKNQKKEIWNMDQKFRELSKHHREMKTSLETFEMSIPDHESNRIVTKSVIKIDGLNVVGTSIHNPDDIYDPAIGYYISMSRVFDQLQKFFRNKAYIIMMHNQRMQERQQLEAKEMKDIRRQKLYRRSHDDERLRKALEGGGVFQCPECKKFFGNSMNEDQTCPHCGTVGPLRFWKDATPMFVNERIGRELIEEMVLEDIETSGGDP